jgi:NADH-quinone oxidoreductase subunit J
MFSNTLFYGFALMAIIAAIRVISAKNPVHAVLSLVVTFFATAALWLLIEAEFLAVGLILIYVGAVLVLFLFIVMMLDVEIAAIKAKFIRYLPVGALVAAAFLTALVLMLRKNPVYLNAVIAPNATAATNNVKELGMLLYTKYLFAIEVAGVLLLAAMVAAISLTFRGARSRKAQVPEQQVLATKRERLKVIDMPSEGQVS